MGCIAATKMPQKPEGVLQQIICDADLFHLSLPEYIYLQKLLLEECQWDEMRGYEMLPGSVVMGEKTDMKWMRMKWEGKMIKESIVRGPNEYGWND